MLIHYSPDLTHPPAAREASTSLGLFARFSIFGKESGDQLVDNVGWLHAFTLTDLFEPSLEIKAKRQSPHRPLAFNTPQRLDYFTRAYFHSF